MLITFNSHSPTHTTSFKIFSLLRNEFFLLGPVMKINSLNIAYTVVKMVRKKKSLLLKVQKCSHVLSQAKNLTVFPDLCQHVSTLREITVTQYVWLDKRKAEMVQLKVYKWNC